MDLTAQERIDRRETARVEAILQVARWSLQEVIAQEGSCSTFTVQLMAAVQHDDPSLTDGRYADLRHRIVSEGLDELASSWHELADIQREVVLAGILGPVDDRVSMRGDWYHVVDLATEIDALTGVHNPADEAVRLLHHRQDQYADQIKMITDWVVSA